MAGRSGDGAATAHYPYQAPIDAYGNGGFRFADMSHRGSLLCLPSGIFSWPVGCGEAIDADSLSAVLEGAASIEIFLLGTGESQRFASQDLRKAFDAAGLAIDAMDTGAACRTYNLLLAERRQVAAALIAVA